MASKKRRRRPAGGGGGGRPQGAPIVDRRGRPLPEWRWATFPVFFALSSGLLLGYVLGNLLSGGKASFSGVALIVYFALLIVFSFSLSRIFNRWMGERVVRRRLRRGE